VHSGAWAPGEPGGLADNRRQKAKDDPVNRRQTLRRLAPLAGLALLGSSMGLAGCTGWRLRGGALEFAFQTILVRGQNQSPVIDRSNPAQSRFPQPFEGVDFANRLRQELKSRHGRTLVERVVDAQVVLRIESLQSRRKAISFSGTGQIREFELYQELVYTIEDARGVALSQSSRLEVTRSVATLETAVLATSNLEEVQRESMESYLLQQLIRQLSALRDVSASTRPQTP
jgi:outer membrane lipopolysaccharide assembly protein LptE/RlpB